MALLRSVRLWAAELQTVNSHAKSIQIVRDQRKLALRLRIVKLVEGHPVVIFPSGNETFKLVLEHSAPDSDESTESPSEAQSEA
jgi:hypothetical protein